MKKRMLLFFAVSLVILGSCDKEPKEKLKPFPIGTWQTNHEYFSLTVADDVYPEFLKEMREKELSGAVTEAKSYNLTFNEDGTGSGTGDFPTVGRYNFEFTWQLSDDEITITGSQNHIPVKPLLYYMRIDIDDLFYKLPLEDDIVLEEVLSPMDTVIWKIEEHSIDNMMLSTLVRMEYNNPQRLDLKETHTYRYTFKKVK